MQPGNRDKAQTQFETQGTLPKPGSIGRFVRLGWGVFLLWSFVNVVQQWQTLVSLETLPHWSFLVIALFTASKVFPYVITIGLGFNSYYKPLSYGLIVMNLVGTGLSWLMAGNLWSPLMGWFVGIWFLYTIGHLGVSFLLSSVLSTPGCEMRSIPQLWSILMHQETKEHFCPGHIDAVDRWEMNLKKKS